MATVFAISGPTADRQADRSLLRRDRRRLIDLHTVFARVVLVAHPKVLVGNRIGIATFRTKTALGRRRGAD